MAEQSTQIKGNFLVRVFLPASPSVISITFEDCIIALANGCYLYFKDNEVVFTAPIDYTVNEKV